MLVERVRELVTRGTPFAEAVRRVRATSVFTTHTPVPAGHDTFSLEQVEQCIGPVWQEMGVSREAFFRLGHHPVADHDRFHMPVAAIRLSSWVSAVPPPEGEHSRRIWAPLWPDREVARVPIGHVTNGVHVATWMANRILTLFDSHFGPDWLARVDDPAFWDEVLELDGAALWAVHKQLKSHLMRSIREQARRGWADQWKEALHLVGAGTLLDQEALTIGFGRRFATYKRADLIFRDLDRLQRLLVNPWRPVQIVFSGKAHPGDEPGKQVLQRVYAHTREARFEGRIAFIEDYDMHLAHSLVQGVDLWLNVPRAPLEACGTSGMKAALNGVPQLSTLDGWWAEGYDGPNGWAIPSTPLPAGLDGDAGDAEQLYRLVENAVAPAERVGVVHLTAEYWPFARTGGLGEAVSGLATTQAAAGHPTTVVMPLYQLVHETTPSLERTASALTVTLGGHTERAWLYRTPPGPGPQVFFIEHPDFFDRAGIYGDNGADYPDNARRFAFFCLAALTALPEIAPEAQLLHAHDWHTALAPVYLRTAFAGQPFYSRLASVLSVHNAGFQGHFPPETMAELGLPPELYTGDAFERYGRMNMLKGGLAFSDVAVTVSPTHAGELRTPDGGFGLHDTFIGLGDRLAGILNGIDPDLWNPEADREITDTYSADDLSGKRQIGRAHV